jgi:hypothetical protein
MQTCPDVPCRMITPASLFVRGTEEDAVLNGVWAIRQMRQGANTRFTLGESGSTHLSSTCSNILFEPWD